MSKKNPSNLPLIIKLESKDYVPEDSEWQEECHQFYTQIKNALDEVTIEPLKLEKEGEGYRSPFGIDIFSTFIAHMAVVGSMHGLTTVIDLAKFWLQRKPSGTEITFKLPDGREIKISGASKEEILNFCQMYLAKPAEK